LHLLLKAAGEKMMAAFVAKLFAQEKAAQAAWSGREAMPWNVVWRKRKKTLPRISADNRGCINAKEIAKETFEIRVHPRKSAVGIWT
jgi:hypothetical protein